MRGHGRGTTEARLQNRFDKSRPEFEIDDDARAFDPPAPLPDPTLPVEGNPVGGRGLLLVRTTADSVEDNREGDRNMLRVGRRI